MSVIYISECDDTGYSAEASENNQHNNSPDLDKVQKEAVGNTVGCTVKYWRKV